MDQVLQKNVLLEKRETLHYSFKIGTVQQKEGEGTGNALKRIKKAVPKKSANTLQLGNYLSQGTTITGFFLNICSWTDRSLFPDNEAEAQEPQTEGAAGGGRLEDWLQTLHPTHRKRRLLRLDRQRH